ncbi:uncharacterized protein DS421_8g225250 [Arachis hypogaea]|nr:uncharacterized protein DS421_8g225250 [Arachis hypogaea]
MQKYKMRAMEMRIASGENAIDERQGCDRRAASMRQARIKRRGDADGGMDKPTKIEDARDGNESRERAATTRQVDGEDASGIDHMAVQLGSGDDASKEGKVMGGDERRAVMDLK